MHTKPETQGDLKLKVTLNIETNDPNDLVRIASALAGTSAVVVQDTPPKAAPKGKPEKAVEPPLASAQTGTVASATSTEVATSTPANAAGQATASEKPPAETATTATVSENDLIAAANQAIANLGAEGPLKVKNYISANFTRADGTPGSLKTTAENQRPALLAALQKIASKEIAV